MELATAMAMVSSSTVGLLRAAMALMGLGLGTEAVARFRWRPSYVDVRRAADQAVRQWGAWE